MKAEKKRIDPIYINLDNLEEVEEALLYNRYLLRRTHNLDKKLIYETNIQMLQSHINLQQENNRVNFN